MIKVNVYKQTNYPVSAKFVKDNLRDFFVKEGIVSNASVSVAFVGEKKMLELGKTYKKDKMLHNVLSFTEDELKGNFIYPPTGDINLGEIIICYPKVLEEAKYEGVLISEKVNELVLHSAEHLMGKHHE